MVQISFKTGNDCYRAQGQQSVEAGADPASSFLSSYIHDTRVLRVCRIITDTDGRPRRSQPVILILEGCLDPFRIGGEVLQALQVIDPALQHEIAVVHLPARPQGRADFEIRFLLQSHVSVTLLPVKRAVLKALTTAYFRILCFFMIGTTTGRNSSVNQCINASSDTPSLR